MVLGGYLSVGKIMKKTALVIANDSVVYLHFKSIKYWGDRNYWYHSISYLFHQYFLLK
ncbi:Uncharacterised protein [Chryseobacterium nakagawai]|nr:Uncharacterised protein [Chryseobacterium nakagawai]